MKKFLLRILIAVAIFLGLLGLEPVLAANKSYKVSDASLSFAFKKDHLTYLTLSPVGLGGYILSPINNKLVSINNKTGNIEEVLNYSSGSFNAFSYFEGKNQLVYVDQAEVEKLRIKILDLKTKKTVYNYLLDTNISNGGQITNISTDGKKIKLIIGYGPSDERSDYYTLNIKTNQLEKIKSVSGIAYK